MSVRGSEGDPGTPKWCRGCPWGGPGSPKWGLGGSWGALGNPLGAHRATLVEKVEGPRKFGAPFGLILEQRCAIFVSFLRSCVGCGFRHSFGTHFELKNKNPSYVKNVGLVIHMVKHI